MEPGACRRAEALLWRCRPAAATWPRAERQGARRLTGWASGACVQGGAHPKEYSPAEVTPALFAHRLRTTVDCGAGPAEHDAAQRAARHTFVARGALGQAGCARRAVACNPCAACGGLALTLTRVWSILRAERRALCGGGPPPAYDAALAPTCSLTARKFGVECAAAVAAVFADCSSGLGLLEEEVCRASASASASAAASAAAAASAVAAEGGPRI